MFAGLYCTHQDISPEYASILLVCMIEGLHLFYTSVFMFLDATQLQRQNMKNSMLLSAKYLSLNILCVETWSLLVRCCLASFHET